jgi:hypothetical protein
LVPCLTADPLFWGQNFTQIPVLVHCLTANPLYLTPFLAADGQPDPRL